MTLILCRSTAGLPALRELGGSGARFVASDDPRVQTAARGLPGVTSVGYIEQMVSFYHVSAEVTALLARIDEGLRSLDPAAPPEALSWGRNVEGGIVNQRVQDALLLIRSYLDLFTTTAATAVVVIGDPETRWEDQVARACAETRSLPCRLIQSQPWASARRAVWERLRPWAVAAYQLLNLFRAGATRLHRRPPRVSLDGAIVFQSHSSLNKHVENIRPLMLALAAQGARPVALCWEASERRTPRPASTVLAREGLRVVSLEDNLSIDDLWRSSLHAIRGAWRARRVPDSWRDLQSRGVALHPLLGPSHAHFFIAELPQRLRYVHALGLALAAAKPAALKLAGGPESFEGQAALRLLASRRDTLVFHYWVGVGPEWPYADGQGRIDLFLAKGPRETHLAAKDYALAPHQIVITGQSRFTATGPRPDVETSRRTLGLPANARVYVGFDPNGALRGYMTVREQIETTQALLAAARAHPDAVLVVKPHPSYPIDHLLPLLTAGGLPNVHVLPRRSPIDHFFNAVDLVVTKFSTLILEASLSGRVPVSVLLDGEDRFRIFGDLPVTVRTTAELAAVLERAAGPAEEFARWREAELARQAAVRPRFYFESADPAALAAAEILRRLPGRAFR